MGAGEQMSVDNDMVPKDIYEPIKELGEAALANLSEKT